MTLVDSQRTDTFLTIKANLQATKLFLFPHLNTQEAPAVTIQKKRKGKKEEAPAVSL